MGPGSGATAAWSKYATCVAIGITARKRVATWELTHFSLDSSGTEHSYLELDGGRLPGVTWGEPELYYCHRTCAEAMREISTTRTRGMPKALCMSGLVVAGLVIILFAADLAVGIPFRRASVTIMSAP